MKRAFRRLCAALLPAVSLVGCSHPNAPAPLPTAQTSAGVRATLTTSPAPAHTGDDTLIVTLADVSTGLPIGDANVSASAESVSPRLPGQSASGRAQGNGVYQVPVVLAIATSYRIRVTAERPGYAPAAFTFPVDVSQ